jgi:hypothetical protein
VTKFQSIMCFKNAAGRKINALYQRMPMPV